MSGLAGHMNHIYDNKDLTFSKLKRILSDAANGKLIATEKLDGVQLYFSFRDGKALGVRNKTEIKNGGLDINSMSQREFKGGEEIKDVYL